MKRVIRLIRRSSKKLGFLLRRIKCMSTGHVWGEWVKVRIALPDYQPKEFSTCRRCNKVRSRVYVNINRF